MTGDPSIGADATVAGAVAASSGELTDLRGSTLSGRYEVRELLGEGAMGAVFRGRHLGLARDVAIKVLKPEFTQHREIAARFEREAKVVSRLQHPGIVEVFDFGRDANSALGRPVAYIVMELLHGGELAALLGAPMDPRLALARVAQILDGIEHAHAQGIVHRDLKPENVFVTETADGREQLKLVDFGIAKLREAGGPALTQLGVVFGTPTYMSPEQAMGAATDERADLYAIGVILYEMLAGRTPFDADDLGALLRMQIHEEPPPIAGLSPGVAALLDGLLAKSPEDRIRSAGEAMAALEAARGSVLADAETVALSARPTVTADTAVPVPSAPPVPRSVPVPAARPRWVVPTVAAGALAAVVMLIAIAVGSGEDPRSDPPTSAPSGDPAVSVAATADPQAIAAIDDALGRKDVPAARDALEGLLAAHPGDARLHWRRGRVLRELGEPPTAAFARAIALDAGVLDSPDVKADLARVLAAKHVDDALLDAVAGAPNAPALLTPLVQRTKNALPYAQRHRALAVVAREPQRASALDHALHRSLDLWQAADDASLSDRCAAYGDGLDAMAKAPDRGHLGTLTYASPPPLCPGLEDRQARILDGHRSEFGGAKRTLPPDYEARRPKKKKRRRGFLRGLLR